MGNLEKLDRAILEMESVKWKPVVIYVDDYAMSSIECQLSSIARYGVNGMGDQVSKVIYRGVEIRRASRLEGEDRILEAVARGDYMLRRKAEEYFREWLCEKSTVENICKK